MIEVVREVGVDCHGGKDYIHVTRDGGRHVSDGFEGGWGVGR